MDTPTLISLIASILSGVLAIVAIILAIVFYRFSESSSNTIKQSSNDIKSSVDKIEALFATFYKDNFELLKDNLEFLRASQNQIQISEEVQESGIVDSMSPDTTSVEKKLESAELYDRKLIPAIQKKFFEEDELTEAEQKEFLKYQATAILKPQLNALIELSERGPLSRDEMYEVYEKDGTMYENLIGNKIKGGYNFDFFMNHLALNNFIKLNYSDEKNPIAELAEYGQKLIKFVDENPSYLSNKVL